MFGREPDRDGSTGQASMALNLERYRRQLEKTLQRVPRKLLVEQTYCPRMWSEVFINDHGEVYFCCHTLPFRVGNVYDSTLEELWGGFRARQARRMSLTRTLYCYDRCTLLTAEEHAMLPGPDSSAVPAYSALTRLKILMGELCNLRCSMCDQDHRSKVHLPLELLKRRIDFTHITDIEFQGGEPMAMKSAKEAYVWLTEELGKKVNFLTNGMLMPGDWAERLCRGSSWLYFSINGVEAETYERVNVGGKLDRVLANLGKVREARERLGSKLELVGHFTMVPDNVGEVDRFPAFAKQHGLDRVEFGYDISAIPRWFDEHPEVRERLRQSFAAQLADPPLPIDTNRLARLGLA